MKTCNTLAAMLFGSIAAAAPLFQRDLVTKTSVVVETVIVYTTVWDQAPPATAADAISTPAGGNFYEQPSQPASQVQPTPSVPAVSSVVVEKPSSKPVISTQAQPTKVYTQPAAPSTTQAPVAPEPTTVYTPPAPVSSAAPSSVVPEPSASAQPSSPPSSGGGSGETYTGDITIYDNNGGFGACGTELTDGSMGVAMNQEQWGSSTYDVMTGEATNPWCGQMITIEYNGNTIEAPVVDLCPECVHGDVDLTLKAWTQLTHLEEKTRLKASWYKSS